MDIDIKETTELIRQGIQGREETVDVIYWGQTPKDFCVQLIARSTYPLDRLAGEYKRRLKDKIDIRRTGVATTRIFCFDKKAVIEGIKARVPAGKVNPEKPEPLFGEIDVGIQKGMFGEEKEVRVMGKGKPAQASLTDWGKVEEMKRQKEPWQMTREEWLIDVGYKKSQGSRVRENWLGTHEGEVQVAVQNRKPVPPEVLKDYPEMAAIAAKAVRTPRELFEAIRSLKPEATITPRKSPVEYDREMTLKQILELAREHNISTSGSKKQLIRKLIDGGWL